MLALTLIVVYLLGVATTFQISKNKLLNEFGYMTYLDKRFILFYSWSSSWMGAFVVLLIGITFEPYFLDSQIVYVKKSKSPPVNKKSHLKVVKKEPDL